jgi:heme oxygenase
MRMTLRSATAGDHEMVDAAFGRFDLASRASYTKFLTAHAAVLGAVESVVSGLWPAWRPRLPLLQADLAELGVRVVAGDAIGTLSEAERWGMLYVVEGSRLGGGILAGRVAQGLPLRYLSAKHEEGSWRHFGEALEQAADLGSDDWADGAASGAKLAFARFAFAADNQS